MAFCLELPKYIQHWVGGPVCTIGGICPSSQDVIGVHSTLGDGINERDTLDTMHFVIFVTIC